MKWGLIALAVSVIFGFYHLTIPLIYKISPYSPLALNTQTSSLSVDEAIAYATKTQEALSGHMALSDLFIWEYKDYPSPLRGEIVPAIMMAGMAKLGGGIDQGFILADFILPVVSFLILTVFFQAMSGKKYFAAVTALMIMFFYHYFRFFPYLPSAIRQLWLALNDGYPSHFLRSFHPQISFPFFMVSLLLIWLMLKNSQRKYLWLYLGISLGLLFYTDFFYWTFILGFIGVVFAWSKKSQYLKSLIIGLMIGLPYLINTLKFQNSSLSQSFIKNMTFKPEDEMIPIGIMLILLLAARWGLKNKIQAIFWQLYYLAIILVLLVSKLAGVAIDDPVGHWKIRIIYPLTMGFLMLLVNERIKLKKSIWLAIAFGLLVYQARVHWQFFNRQAQAFQIEPDKVGAFEWINQNINKDSVILTSSLKDNLYLAIFTHANVFIPRSQHSLAPDIEALERFLLLYKAAGIPAERVKTMFSLTEDNQRLKTKGRFNFDDCGGHYLYFRRFIKNDYYNCSVSAEQLSQIMKNYEAIEGSLAHWKNKYRLDYWLWGPQEQAWAKMKPKDFENWQLVFANSSYQLFKLPE
ncbi:MAG: hypothetical protein AAB430_00875 [Patescibacteria group bacterium]